ncbi:hypothetical protein I3843_04G098700 [Carya illinoinensis]|nr:hypothetical protein I3843_04G098700 [Carya illinoinensis]
MAGVKRRMHCDSDICALHKEEQSTLPSSLPVNSHNPGNTSDMNMALSTDLNEASENHNVNERVEVEDLGVENSSELKLSLQCPLCRGTYLAGKFVEEARKYLNLKKRSCSRESCSFFGNYQELRRHARRVHPTTRPSDIDPSREQAWRHLEHQREYGDIVSAIRSAMPGAVVGERQSGAGDTNGPWWTTLFLFQMIGSMDSVGEPRARSRAWTRHRRTAGSSSERRFLWGENLLGLHDEDASPVPRRLRRLARSRSNEDRP